MLDHICGIADSSELVKVLKSLNLVDSDEIHLVKSAYYLIIDSFSNPTVIAVHHHFFNFFVPLRTSYFEY